MRPVVLLAAASCAHRFEPPYAPVEDRDDRGRVFAPDELRADVATFASLLEDVHPDPFTVTSEADFRARRAALDASLDRPMGRLAFYQALAPLVASIGDGHTTLSFDAPELADLGDAHALGVTVGVRAGQLTYQASLETGTDVPPVGTPIVAIDGHPAAELYRDFLSYESGERTEFREDRAEDHFAYHWWMAYGTAPTATLSFAPGADGAPRSLVVTGLDLATRQGFRQADLGCRFGESGDLLQAPADPWPERRAVVVERVEPGSGCEAAGVPVGARVISAAGVPIGHRADLVRALISVEVGAAVELELSGPTGPVRKEVVATAVPPRGAFSRRPSPPGVQVVELRSMRDPAAFGAFLDETFDQMEREGRADLVVDLRDDGGGDSALIDTFCERVSRVPWTVYARIETRSSPATWAYWDHYVRTEVPWALRFVYRAGWLHPLRTRAEDGLFVQASEPGGHVPRSPFPGRVVVLTSRFTFSSAADFAAVMKDFGIATLVGEETGGLASSFGELYETSLPNTGLTLGLSQKRFVRPNGVVDDRGVLPDVEVASDRALEAALAWLADPANRAE